MPPADSHLLSPSSQKSIQWRFIAFSSLFFVASTTIFILALSTLRINDLKAEQAVAASTFISQLTSIAVNTEDQILDKMIPAYLGTLIGDRIFNCISLDIASLNKAYSWPSDNCSDFRDGEVRNIHNPTARFNNSTDKILIHYLLDRGAPLDKYLLEGKHIAWSAFLMGLFALLAVNFAFNWSFRRPLKKLLDELLAALAGADGNSWSSDPNDSRISRFSGAYEAMLERARELRRKEAFWRTITDSSHNCVISIDKQGCIIDFNVESENTFGHQREAVLGSQLLNLIVPSRHMEHWNAYFHSKDGKTHRKTQKMELLRANGSEFPAEFTFKEISIEDDQFFTIYLWDVSNILAREQELREARNAAEEASIAKSSFLAMMSHEIRTPLNAVHGALGLIGSSELDSSQKKFLDVGKKGAESLLLIINDILDFSRLEAGKLILEPTLFDPEQTIKDVIQVLEPRTLEKQISLSQVSGFKKPEYLIGDASRVRQVLLNLCSNAVRFTVQGHVYVDCSCDCSEDDIARIRYTVKDTGKGVSVVDQEHLFEEFWGQNNSGSQSNRGTGLGLPISKKLVEMMGGSIGFESELGRGSTFWFEIPMQRAGHEALAERGIRDSAIHSLPDNNLTGLRGRVLVAEDNPANQLISRAMLERLGLQVDVVANGHEAIEAVRSCPYDLILMDVNMPEMDGIEATRAIRKFPDDLASIPIIAMTALAMPGDKEMILSMGMDDYVSKPVIREELYVCIAKVLKDAKSLNTDFSEATKTDSDDNRPALVDSEVIALLKINVGSEMLPQIIDAYLSENSARADSITRAAELGDCDLVVKQAHPLKSSSASVGAMRLADLASSLEQAGREQDLGKIKKQITSLACLSDQTRTALLNLEILQTSK